MPRHKGTIGEFRQHCTRPERVVWAVASFGGEKSICPLGWHMTTSFTPPMIAISVAPERFTHSLITNSREVTLSWPGKSLAEATLFCGTNSTRDVDKFAKIDITPTKADFINAPMIEECIANLECRIVSSMETGDHTIFACQILQTWVNDHPEAQLCTVDHSAGYEFLVERNGYCFGVVRR